MLSIGHLHGSWQPTPSAAEPAGRVSSTRGVSAAILVLTAYGLEDCVFLWGTGEAEMCAFLLTAVERVLFTSAASQLPPAQDNQYTKAAQYEMTHHHFPS